MKVIQNKFIPFPGYSYINLFGLLFTRNKNKISEKTYNHEKIHLKQMQEMLFGEKPSFEDIIEALIDLEDQLRTLAEKHESR